MKQSNVNMTLLALVAFSFFAKSTFAEQRKPPVGIQFVAYVSCSQTLMGMSKRDKRKVTIELKKFTKSAGGTKEEADKLARKDCLFSINEQKRKWLGDNNLIKEFPVRYYDLKIIQ